MGERSFSHLLRADGLGSLRLDQTNGYRGRSGLVPKVGISVSERSKNIVQRCLKILNGRSGFDAWWDEVDFSTKQEIISELETAVEAPDDWNPSEFDIVKAEMDVLRGVDCGVNGDGPCGVCVKCLRDTAERLVFAMHIYSNYRMDSRGPSGCLMSALKVLHSKAFSMLSEGHDPGDVYEKFWGDSVEED